MPIEWNRRNPDRMREYARNYYWRHHDRLRASAMLRTRKNRILRKKTMFDELGNKCAKCGITDIRVLQLDHIHGGGRAEQKHHNNTDIVHSRDFKDRITFKLKYQILCSNCNWIKRYENGEVKLSREFIEIFGISRMYAF